ncbi:NAD(P)/FAD-dependent oxidoreductase [Chloroflexota bacterium]
MPDVIVVGAGPAGSAAAKRCAEYGLDTLMLEKRRLPRDKVCSGMIMGPVAHTLIKQEFGNIPEAVLSQPSQLNGYMFHTPGVGYQSLDNFTLLTWRRNLDYWMSEKAQAKGAEIWQGARVTAVRQKEPGFLVQVEKDREKREIEARFVIGADGAASIARRALFPELKVSYGQIYQEWYQGELDLDRRYFHWFYPLEFSPAMFTAHHKDNLIVVDFGGPPGILKPLIGWVKNFLAKNYHLDTTQKPVWRGGCVEPVLFKSLISHTFLPAKGNALLVGDAAGLLLPVSGEGISTCLKSGLLAADSIIKAIKSGGLADSIYLNEVEGIISTFAQILPSFKKILMETRGGGHSLPQILAKAYADTLRTF